MRAAGPGAWGASAGWPPGNLQACPHSAHVWGGVRGPEVTALHLRQVWLVGAQWHWWGARGLFGPLGPPSNMSDSPGKAGIRGLSGPSPALPPQSILQDLISTSALGQLPTLAARGPPLLYLQMVAFAGYVWLFSPKLGGVPEVSWP